MDYVSAFKNNFGFFTPIYYDKEEGVKKSCTESFLEAVDGYFDYGTRLHAEVSKEGDIKISLLPSNQSRSILCLKKASCFTVVIPIIMLLVKFCTYPLRRAKISNLNCVVENKNIGKVKDVFSRHFKEAESSVRVNDKKVDIDDKEIDDKDLLNATPIDLNMMNCKNLNLNENLIYLIDEDAQGASGEKSSVPLRDIIQVFGQKVNEALEKEPTKKGFVFNIEEDPYFKKLQNLYLFPSSDLVLIFRKMVDMSILKSFVIENGVCFFRK